METWSGSETTCHILEPPVYLKIINYFKSLTVPLPRARAMSIPRPLARCRAPTPLLIRHAHARAGTLPCRANAALCLTHARDAATLVPLPRPCPHVCSMCHRHRSSSPRAWARQGGTTAAHRAWVPGRGRAMRARSVSRL